MTAADAERLLRTAIRASNIPDMQKRLCSEAIDALVRQEIVNALIAETLQPTPPPPAKVPELPRYRGVWNGTTRHWEHVDRITGEHHPVIFKEATP